MYAMVLAAGTFYPRLMCPCGKGLVTNSLQKLGTYSYWTCFGTLVGAHGTCNLDLSNNMRGWVKNSGPPSE